jgi:hypothetical protein
VFEAGQARLRHVEVIAKLLDSPAAHRLSPQVWAGAEATLAAKACEYTPTQLLSWGAELIEKLDADGPEPDDRPPVPVNELHLLPHRGRPGGSLKARFDDPALYDAIAAVIDAKSAPRTGDDERSAARRSGRPRRWPRRAGTCSTTATCRTGMWRSPSAPECDRRTGGPGRPGPGGDVDFGPTPWTPRPA